MSSIKDVARHTGLSIATVSRYFNEPQRVRAPTRERIETAITQLGYAPNTLARNFRAGKTRLILVLSQSISDPLHGEIIAGLTDVANAQGFVVRLQDARQLDPATSDFVDLITSRQADGIVILGQAGVLTAKTRALDSGTLPIVVCGETSDPNLMHFPRFEVDGRRAMAEMTRHLIALGHRRIGLIKASIPLFEVRQREIGYAEALEAAGLPLDPALIADGHFRAHHARDITAQWLQEPAPPTAILCATDEMALGVLAELHARGIRVPEEISVTGYDDTRYASQSCPALTTVAQPARQMGERGMLCLLRLIAGKPVEAGVTYLDHQLILRRSVAPPPRPA